MDLKAFKGLPHEFGGIDYTEGSEVEGGEFAVNIGKSGNEYIFDKNSSEGKKLSKEFKRLDMNGRLSEDDPLSLETFDQIAREEALKHAQRSVNEKGIDPFRNMYDEGGQAANGGVKYANGGVKDMYCSGGVNKYATGGYNPRAMGTDPYDNYMMDPLQMRNQPLSSEISGGYELFQDNGSSFINNLTGSTTNNSINLSPQDNLSYNNPNSSPAPQQRLAMEPIPTIDAYQLPTQSYGEMPTADKSYDVSSADISGAAGGGAGGGSPMGMITKGLGMASDAITAIQGPQYKGGSDSIIAEKGQTRQKSVAPKYGYSTSGEMMGEAMKGMSKGAEMGSMAGPIGGAIGAAAGMIIAPMMKGMKEEKANKALQLQFKNQLIQKNAEERRDEQWDAISKDVDFNGKIDKDRYAGLIGLGSTQNKFAKQGGALPKNKGIYGYYANGGGVGDPVNGGNYNIDPSLGAQLEQIRYERGVDTLGSGITYQDLQGGRSHPVYDEAGNEISGVRNIGASSMSPGFDIRTNTYQPPVRTNTPQSRFGTGPQINNTMRRQELSAQPVRQSAPQQYSFQAQDPCADNGLNQGFNLYNKPRKYAQKGNYYNPESLQKNEFVGPPEMSITDPLNPNFVGPPEDLGATLINNETGQSYQFQHGGSHSYTDKIKEAENDLNQSLGNPMSKAKDDFTNELQNNPRLAGDDMYLDPYRHGMAGYYTADAMRKKMPDWMPESVANKLAIAGSTIAGVGHEFASPSTERMGLVDALTEAGQDAYNNYVGASMIEDVLFDREAKQLMLNKIKKEETYPGVVISDSDPYVKRDNTLKTVPFNTANLKTVKLQDGGGKKEEELLTGPTGAQGVIGAEGVIGPSTGYLTSNQVSSEDFASDPGMIPVRRDDTCVKGMNCFEDIAGMDIIPNWIVNNRDLEKFLNSPEGKEAYEQVSAIDAKAGDMVQFTRPVDVTNPKTGAKEAASYALNYGGNPLNYPYHVGLMNSDSTYLGDGSAELPVHEKSIYMDDDKRFDFESAGIFGDVAKFFMTDDNKKKANYYRLKDNEARQKQLDAAIKAKKDGVDISRQLYKNETPTGYVGNPYYNSRGSYPSAY
jgi:hypothetical protein